MDTQQTAPKTRKLSLNRPLRTILMLCAVALLAIFGLRFYKTMTKSSVRINNAPTKTWQYRPNSVKFKQFDAGSFTLELPEDWVYKGYGAQGSGAYVFQGTKGESASRIVNVYLDDLPLKMAVNRLVRVEVSDGRIVSSGDVSDNCVSFTGGQPTGPSAVSSAPAKWRGVDFICDTGNYTRNVTGVGMAGAVNRLRLISLSGASRDVFITYTDNSPSPDYSVLDQAIRSFVLK